VKRRPPLSTLALLLCALGLAPAMALAQSAPAAEAAPGTAAPVNAPANAFPYYSAEQAMQGLYGHHLPPLAAAFEAQAQALAGSAAHHCQGQAPLAELRAQWRQTLLAWQSLSTPAVGPVVERRSQRQIDFWPTRPALLRKALEKAPQTLADMDRVGTPAKGFSALERLLFATSAAPSATRLDAATCSYVHLSAQAIAVEAQALKTELDTLATQDWTASPEATGTAMAEWVNQWLAGLERLRWAHIGKPIQSHQTSGKGGTIAFPRQTPEHNLADWRAQWQSLRAQARLSPAQRQTPPEPGQALVPLEALLIGKGQLALAQRWAQALDRADAGLAQLQPQSGPRELQALTATLQAVTVLFQNEVAAALDIPLGFSDADGD